MLLRTPKGEKKCSRRWKSKHMFDAVLDRTPPAFTSRVLIASLHEIHWTQI